MSDAATLLTEYRSLRERAHNGEPGLRASAAIAYNRWFKQACAEGNPPDSLQRFSKVESERFFARVIPGPDGHCYWDGEPNFRKNDKRRRSPRFWWWEYVHGEITDRSIVKPVCGEPNCITLEHQQLVPWADIQRRFTDEQCLGALQVAAMRLGHTPTIDQYDKTRIRPTSAIIKIRFSSWVRAIKAAGLSYDMDRFGKQWTTAECLDALRHFYAAYGYAPTQRQWRIARQLPSDNTLKRRFGSWDEALAAAGLKRAA